RNLQRIFPSLEHVMVRLFAPLEHRGMPGWRFAGCHAFTANQQYNGGRTWSWGRESMLADEDGRGQHAFAARHYPVYAPALRMAAKAWHPRPQRCPDRAPGQPQARQGTEPTAMVTLPLMPLVVSVTVRGWPPAVMSTTPPGKVCTPLSPPTPVVNV